MVGTHYQLKGYEFEQTPGDGEGKPGLLQSTGSQRVGHDLVPEQQQCRPSILLSTLPSWTKSGFFKQGRR